MSADDFQTKYASVMESMLKSAIAETTKLFSNMVDELKAEISKIKQENEDLKTKCIQYETAKSQPVELTGESSLLLEQSDVSDKCDSAVQCDMVPYRTVLVEECQPLESTQQNQEHVYDWTGHSLHEHNYVTYEDKNIKMSLVNVKQEVHESDNSFIEPAMKQEEVETEVVSGQILTNRSVGTSVTGVELEEPKFSQESSAELITSSQINETPLVLQLPCSGINSSSQATQNQSPNVNHSLVISLKDALSDDIKEESDVCPKIRKANAPSVKRLMFSPKIHLDNASSVNEQTGATAQGCVGVHATNEQLPESTPISKELPCNVPKGEANTKRVSHRRGRPPKKNKPQKRVVSSHAKVSRDEMLTVPSTRQENIVTSPPVIEENISSPKFSKTSSDSFVSPLIQEGESTSVEEGNRNVETMFPSVEPLSGSLLSEKQPPLKSLHLSTVVEKDSAKAQSHEDLLQSETPLAPFGELSQTNLDASKKCYTSVSLQDAMLLVEAMNQSTVEHTNACSQITAEPQSHSASIAGPPETPAAQQTPSVGPQPTAKILDVSSHSIVSSFSKSTISQNMVLIHKPKCSPTLLNTPTLTVSPSVSLTPATQTVVQSFPLPLIKVGVPSTTSRTIIIVPRPPASNITDVFHTRPSTSDAASLKKINPPPSTVASSCRKPLVSPVTQQTIKVTFRKLDPVFSLQPTTISTNSGVSSFPKINIIPTLLPPEASNKQTLAEKQDTMKPTTVSPPSPQLSSMSGEPEVCLPLPELSSMSEPMLSPPSPQLSSMSKDPRLPPPSTQLSSMSEEPRLPPTSLQLSSMSEEQMLPPPSPQLSSMSEEPRLPPTSPQLSSMSEEQRLPPPSLQLSLVSEEPKFPLPSPHLSSMPEEQKLPPPSLQLSSMSEEPRLPQPSPQLSFMSEEPRLPPTSLQLSSMSEEQMLPPPSPQLSSMSEEQRLPPTSPQLSSMSEEQRLPPPLLQLSPMSEEPKFPLPSPQLSSMPEEQRLPPPSLQLSSMSEEQRLLPPSPQLSSMSEEQRLPPPLPQLSSMSEEPKLFTAADTLFSDKNDDTTLSLDSFNQTTSTCETNDLPTSLEMDSFTQTTSGSETNNPTESSECLKTSVKQVQTSVSSVLPQPAEQKPCPVVRLTRLPVWISTKKFVSVSRLQEDQSGGILQQTSLTPKNTSDSQLHMTKAQFLQQLSISPLRKEFSTSESSDASDTRTSGQQKKCMVSLLRSHLKTILKARSATEQETDGQTETIINSPKKPRLEGHSSNVKPGSFTSDSASERTGDFGSNDIKFTALSSSQPNSAKKSMSLKTRKSTSMSPRRSTSDRVNIGSKKQRSTSVSPRRPTCSNKDESSTVSRNGFTPKCTKSSSLRPEKCTNIFASPEKTPSVRNNITRPSVPGSSSSNSFMKGSLGTKSIKKESNSFSSRCSNGTKVCTTGGKTKREMDSLKMSKSSTSVEGAEKLTPNKKPRKNQDCHNANSNHEIKLIKAVKIRGRRRKRKNNNTERQKRCQTKGKVLKICRAKVWYPPTLPPNEVPSVEIIPAPRLKVEYRVPTIPPQQTPIVSPLQPLSVIGRHLLRNQCGECGRVFGSSTALESHVSLHKLYRPFTCKLCGKYFPDAKTFKRHDRVHRNGRIHTCPQCGKGFVYRFGVGKHIQMVHKKFKPFVCQVCNKGFYTKKDVESHILIHTGEKPFKCHVCEKKFTRKVELNVHLRWHNGEKRHWCSYCGKGFLDANNLKRHKYTHTGEKPYSCPHCPKTFTQTGHMKKHISSLHPSKAN